MISKTKERFEYLGYMKVPEHIVWIDHDYMSANFVGGQEQVQQWLGKRKIYRRDLPDNQDQSNTQDGLNTAFQYLTNETIRCVRKEFNKDFIIVYTYRQLYYNYMFEALAIDPSEEE